MDLLPDDILAKIFQNLCIGDRFRLKLVCNLWNRILTQHHIPMAPEAPWEILSDDTFTKPASYSSQICFKSMSEEKIYKFQFPTLDGKEGGGLCCGSSRGWLAITVGSHLNPDIYLWNPLSGATRKLPPVSTLPFFEDCVADRAEGPIKITYFSSVIIRVEVFSLGCVECVVAVVFQTRTGQRIALCTPREVQWTVFDNAEEAENITKYYEDILFRAGKLIVLAKEKFPSEAEREAFLSREFRITLKDCKVELNPILIRDKDVNLLEDQPDEGQITLDSTTHWRLVESSVTGQVLFVVAHLSSFRGGPLENFMFQQTRTMSVRSSVDDDNMVSMAKEAIFLGDICSLSVPMVHGTVPEPDCIHFATSNAVGQCNIVPIMCLLREYGQFYVSRNKFSHRTYTTPKYPCASKIGWFAPQF